MTGAEIAFYCYFEFIIMLCFQKIAVASRTIRIIQDVDSNEKVIIKGSFPVILDYSSQLTKRE